TYPALAPSVRYPDPDMHARGLRPLLQKALDDPALPRRFVEQSPVPEYCPVGAALRALADCPSQSAYDDIVLWLSGQIRPTREMKTCLKRPPALYATGEVARQYAYALAALSVLCAMARSS